MGKEPCENCGLTNYNFVRRCHSHARVESMRGCGKFGCDHCFRPGSGIPNSYFCPDCFRTADGSFAILMLISIIVVLAFFYVLGTSSGLFEEWANL